MKNIAEVPINRVCNCIAINHPLHKKGECDEPARPTGEGDCYTCHYLLSPAKETYEERVRRHRIEAGLTYGMDEAKPFA